MRFAADFLPVLPGGGGRRHVDCIIAPRDVRANIYRFVRRL